VLNESCQGRKYPEGGEKGKKYGIKNCRLLKCVSLNSRKMPRVAGGTLDLGS
jgi:hypothetical protein